MSTRSVKHELSVASNRLSDAGRVITGAEAQKIVAEAKKNGVTAGERAAIKDAFTRKDLSTEAKAVFNAFLDGDTKSPINLGVIDPPGPALAGKTFHLEPGQAMVFEYYGNQITNTDIKAPAPLTVQTETLNTIHALGDRYHYRVTLTAPHDAAAGKAYQVEGHAAYQSRNDPDWQFTFKVTT